MGKNYQIFYKGSHVGTALDVMSDMWLMWGQFQSEEGEVANQFKAIMDSANTQINLQSNHGKWIEWGEKNSDMRTDGIAFGLDKDGIFHFRMLNNQAAIDHVRSDPTFN